MHDLDVSVVAAQRVHRGPEQIEQLGLARRDLLGELRGQPVPVDRERPGRGGRGVVARLGHDPVDVAPHLFGRIRGRGQPRVEVGDELTTPVGQHREEQRVP